MFTPTVLKSIGQLINFGYTLNAVTFYWDYKTQRLYNETSGFKWILCFCQLWTLVCVCLFILEKIILIHIRLLENDPLVVTVFVLFLFGAFIVFPIGFGFLSDADEFIRWFNSHISYFQNVAESYSEGCKTVECKSSLIVIGLCKAYIVIAISMPWMCLILTYMVFLPTKRQVFITTCTFFPLPPSTLLVLLTGIPGLWILYFVLALIGSAFAAAIAYIFGMVFLLKEVNPKNVNSTLTDNRLRSPNEALLNYRCLQLIHNTTNEMFHLIVLTCLILFVVVSIALNTCIVLYIHELHFGLIPFVIITVTAQLYQNLILYKLGLIDKMSRDWMKSWKCYKYQDWSQLDIRQMKKYIKSCQPLAFDIGPMGHIKICTNVKIAGKILYYTGKIILTFQKLHFKL